MIMYDYFYNLAFPPILLERKANAIKKQLGIRRNEYNRVHTPYQGDDRR